MAVNILSVLKNECCRKLRKEECHDVYSLPNIMMIKSSTICMGKACSTHRKEEIFILGFIGRLERHNQEDLSVDGIILKCNLTI